MAEIPFCARSIKNRGCEKSDVRLTGETEDAWVFQCFSCKAVQVVSKDGVRDKNKFELAAQRKREAEEIERIRRSKKTIFA